MIQASESLLDLTWPARPYATGPVASGRARTTTRSHAELIGTRPTISGRYEIFELLGEGGMGQVYAAREVGSGRPVALKLLRVELIRHPEASRRFAQEAVHTSALAGPHAVRVFDVGVADTGQPYIAMERLYGEDLARVLEREGPLSVLDAVHWVKQACAAMGDAHARGILHRDLKPSNLFIAHDGEGCVLKVLDFGISHDMEDASSRLTKTSTTIGTPAYMSPEQAKSARGLDVRTDIWALGVILYELLTDALPFDASSATAAALAACNDEPVPPSDRRRDIPRAIEEVILRALAKSPADRYASTDELAAALDLALLSAPADLPIEPAKISATRPLRPELAEGTTLVDRPRVALRGVVSLALGGVSAFVVTVRVLLLAGTEPTLALEPARPLENPAALPVLSLPLRSASAAWPATTWATPSRPSRSGSVARPGPRPMPSPALPDGEAAAARQIPRALFHRPAFNERF